MQSPGQHVVNDHQASSAASSSQSSSVHQQHPGQQYPGQHYPNAGYPNTQSQYYPGSQSQYYPSQYSTLTRSGETPADAKQAGRFQQNLFIDLFLFAHFIINFVTFALILFYRRKGRGKGIRTQFLN